MALQIHHRPRKISPRKIWLPAGALVVLGLAAILYAYHAKSESSETDIQAAETTESQLVDSLVAIHPQAPVRLEINSIDVDAPVVPVGTEPNGNMSAPDSATDVGWYKRSSGLGESRRSMLLDGHYGLDSPEVFRRLTELKQGDAIAAIGEAGGRAVYSVVETERQYRTDVDMEKAFNYGEGEESMTIITCIGNYDYEHKTYDDRYIVYAVRVQ